MKKVFEIELNLENAISEAAKLTAEIEKLKEEQKKATKGTEEWEYVSNSLKITKESYKELTKEIKRLTMEKELENASIKDATELLKKNVNTIGQAEEQNRRIAKLKKNLNVNDEKQKALLIQLNSKLEENTKFIRDNSDAEHRRILNIGNYKSALEGINSPIIIYYKRLKSLRSAMIANAAATKTGSNSLKMFRIALISTGIGAIVVVLGMLVSAFLKTQKGIDMVNRVLEPMKVIMQSLWGVVEKVATGLFDAFSKPKKAMNDLYNFVKQNLINRFTAFGKILQGIVEMDFEKIGNGMLQAATGVENLTGKVRDMASETNKMLDEAYQRGRKIALLNEQVDKMEIARNFVLEKNKTLIKEQELIAKNRNKTEKERLKAVRIAESASKANLEFETEILKKKIEALKLSEKSNDTSNEDYKKRLDLEAELERKKQEASATELRFLGVKNQLVKEGEKKRLENLKKYQAKVLETLKNEIENYKLKNQALLNQDEKLNDKLVAAKINYYNHLKILQKKQIDEEYKQKFGNGYQKELAYQNAILALENNINEKKQELYAQFKTQQAAKEQEERDAEFARKQEQLALELQEIEFEEISKYDKKIEVLNIKKEQELLALKNALEKETLTTEVYSRKKALIEKKYQKEVADATVKIEKIKTAAKMKSLESSAKMTHQAANIATALFGKNKMVSSAVALVDTYVGAQKAYLSQMQVTPDAPIRAALAAASAVATGLANVAAINKVQVGSSSGGSSAPAPRTTPTGAANLPTINNTPTPTGSPQGNIINTANNPQIVRVVNVARDTTDIAGEEIRVENYANI